MINAAVKEKNHAVADEPSQYICSSKEIIQMGLDKSDVGDSATTGREKSPDDHQAIIPGRVANKVPKFGTSMDFDHHSETVSSLIRKARVSVRARSDAYMVSRL